ncbi:MAG TPA: hypothetical protein VMX11_01765, partial [Actinomycetes bacterium]|nr:hypothetical protein [Actinomycetes bacterium]
MTRHVAGFANAEGTKVQALTSLGFAADLVVHAAATDLDFLTPGSPAADALVWEAVSKTKLDALDCDTDRQGNLYVLVDGGLIEKFNSAGTLISSITIPAVSSEVLVRRIEVSDINIVYTVTRNEATGKGTAYAFNEVERVGEKFFDVLWTLELDLVPYDFSVRGTLMYVLSEVEEDDNAPVYSVVQLITGISDPQAYPLQQFAVPSRPSSLAVGPQGAVFVTCPSQVRRTATPAGFTAITTGWSPHDLTASQQRIYGWWDAASLLDAVDGKKIKEIPYRRTFAVDQGATATEILDTTKRPLVSIDGPGSQKNREPPRYGATAFGAMPGIVFDQGAAPPGLRTETRTVADENAPFGVVVVTETPTEYVASTVTTPVTVDDLTSGQGIVSRTNSDPLGKSSVSDFLPQSRAIIPGYDAPVFMLGMVLRVTRGSGPSIVFQHKGDDFQFGILANLAEGVDASTGDLSTSITDGSLYFFYGDAAARMVTAGDKEDALYSTVRWDATDNTTDCVIITLIQDSGDTFLRVNGER